MRENRAKVTTFTLLVMGVFFVVLSAIYDSSFLAILGSSFIFWSVILIYFTPSKYVPISLIEASANSAIANLERILVELNLNEKAIYLTPALSKSIEKSIIYIPRNSVASMSKIIENNGGFFSKNNNGIVLTAPGESLCLLFEKELGKSFSSIDLPNLKQSLTTVFVKKLELCADVELTTKDRIVTIKLVNNVLQRCCIETTNNKKAHRQIGCILSSALGCLLAKATGKPLIIIEEINNLSDRQTIFKYLLEA